MGEIVREWLTFKLGLEIPATDDPEGFRRELANGILFAEVLRKYGVLSDDEFVSLRHNNSRKTRAKNMLAIHNWLTNSGMDISNGILMEVAKERIGAGVKFLYELYLWLEGGAKSPDEEGKSEVQNRSSSVTFTRVDGGRLSEAQGRKDTLPCNVPIERKWERSLSLVDDDADLLKFSGLQEPQSNWYTTLDPVPVPEQALQTAPFQEVGEAAEAENVYLSAEAVEILRKQEQTRAEFKCMREKRLEAMRVPFDIPWERYVFCPPKAACMKEFKRQERHCAEERQAWLLMEQFDENKKTTASMVPRKERRRRVYCDGRGDSIQLEKSVAAIKCRVRTQAKESEQRSSMRRAAAKRLSSDIPCSMYYILQNEVMECLTRLPTSERLLANFILQSHTQRQSFIQHTIYETAQLIQAYQTDLEKQGYRKQADDELEAELRKVVMVKPDRKLLDPDEEAHRIDNEFMAEALLNNLARLVVKVAAFRKAAGKECLETDADWEEEEDTDPQYRVILDERQEEFVMEPSRWAAPGSRTTFQDPLPPLLPMSPEGDVGQEDTFLIKHIALLLDRFLQVANGSLIPVRVFTVVLEDLLLLSIRCAPEGERAPLLPPAWLRLTPPLLRKLVGWLMGKKGFINWRNFLLACLDLPYPDQAGIIAALQQFQELDPSGAFFTNKFGFDQVKLWFESTDELTTLKSVFQSLHIRECLFFMFADVHGNFYYVDFLLYFSKDNDPIFGIIKALAVLTGRVIDTANLKLPSPPHTHGPILTDSDMEIFFEGTVLPHKRDSLVPQNSPKKKFDFSSRMAAMRRRYMLFTSGSVQTEDNVLNINADDTEPQSLMARLTLEEEKNEASRHTESEQKRKRKICARGHHLKHKHRHGRLTPQSSMTSGASEIRLHDLDRLKLLFEKELEGETDSLHDHDYHGHTQRATSTHHPHEKVDSDMDTEHAEVEEESERNGVVPTQSSSHEDTGIVGAEASVLTATAETGTQTPDDEEEEEWGGEAQESSGQDAGTFAKTIPSEAFLQAIWFGHITSFPVSDPSFMSADYFKYKEFLEVAYEELYEKAAVMDGEIYMTYLTQILQHPFVVEIIKRFITFKIVDLRALLHKVLADTNRGVTFGADVVDTASSIPATGRTSEYYGESEMEGEFDVGLRPVSAKMGGIPRTRTASVLTGRRTKKPRKNSKSKIAADKGSEGSKSWANRLVTIQPPGPDSSSSPTTGVPKGSKLTASLGAQKKKPKKKKK